jgi:RNA polymerase sigma factor (sigma-70 family)
MGIIGKSDLDGDELSQILAEHSGVLHIYLEKHIPRTLASQIAADDVLQEVWIAAFRSIEVREWMRRRDLATWLRTTAQRKLLDAIKAAARIKRGGPAHQTWFGSGDHPIDRRAESRTPSKEMALREISHAVRLAILNLPTAQRAAMLHHVDGLSLDRIAQRMSKTKAAVRGLLFRGMQFLRHHFSDHGTFLLSLSPYFFRRN